MQIGPYVDDMPAAYMLADVVVAPGGPREGFSRAMIEAQAMGRPVVAEDGGGAAEAVRDGVTGWLAPAGDAAAMATHWRPHCRFPLNAAPNWMKIHHRDR